MTDRSNARVATQAFGHATSSRGGVKLLACMWSTCLLLLFAAFEARAEIKLTNDLARDIGRAYGFYLGQDYSLKQIAKKFPSLSGPALVAEKEFIANFGSSIERMDALMSRHAKEEWKEIKNDLAKQISSGLDIDVVSEAQAGQFVDFVRQRAQGSGIESPVLEILLLFNPSYEARPEEEFLDGYRYKFDSSGLAKAKGVKFTIEVPRTWFASDGERPNIVQKFISENGRGLTGLLVLIKDLPLAPGEEITPNDVEQILNPTLASDFLPTGATFIKSGMLSIENQPGFWVRFRAQMSRVHLRCARR